MMYVYGLRERNSKFYRYVGITTKSNVMQRYYAHLSSARTGHKLQKVHKWIRECGIDNVIAVDILEEVLEEDGNEYLEEREKFWISSLKYLGYDLLNVSTGGKLPNGYRHSEEQKLRWSEQRKGSISGELNPNWGKKGSLSHMYGREVSVETRQKLSVQRKGDKNPNYGRKYSVEERAEMSRVRKGKPMPSSRVSAHTRWHTNRGVSKPDTCKYCQL